MNKFLTVIVRVYNREKSIVNCLNSILSQTTINDIQILVINDCSTDNSLNVINKIKEDNPNVCIDIVSHEKNMGRGKALNTSKQYIEGKYCMIKGIKCLTDAIVADRKIEYELELGQIDGNCYDSDNRMWFTVTGEGTGIQKRRYWFSESFAVVGSAELYRATKEVKYLETEQMRKVEDIMDEYYASEVDYSGTNAVIDLTKLFCSKHGFLALSCCNLSGLDLSCYDLSGMEYVSLSSCNISNTGMRIPNNVQLKGEDSDLSFLDLSNHTIDGSLYLEDYNRANLSNCLLCNTCININFNFSDFTKLCVKYANLSDEKLSFNDVLVKKWRGCFVNGQFTLPIDCPENKISFYK